ncbi:DinB superfamily protein [Marivirga sericea]|uniref:DinB superfamily protein n=1 Tax=Marivirga sericea TaxID=1028 RepID=A0A1X7L416_9BACT|nr:DinB family protein [Marivirga sericea]SMG48490.1 DinB superfamily protein [Marivirga sericea]
MTNKEEHIKAIIGILRNELEQLFAFFEQDLDYHKMVYEFWNAKDILGHITFWHESFARNISDLGKGIKPKPLRGKLSEVNNQSVETTKNESIEHLIKRLKVAQATIEEFIVNDKINLIPYKKGARDYTRSEHLEVVSNHIHKHLKDISKKYGTT